MKYTDHLICDGQLLQHVRLNLKNFDIRRHEQKGLKQAAVAIAIVDVADDTGIYGISAHRLRHEDAAIILTRRSSRLRNHAGQWALPGGRAEADELPEQTALRELAEEVGLELSHENVIGRLDDFTTRSGFVISPVVVWGGPDITLTPDFAEVASVHRIPIAELMRDDAPILEEIPGSKHPVLMMPVGNNWIAAPTAALLYQFREAAILGKDTRVAHYEQPFFAWN